MKKFSNIEEKSLQVIKPTLNKLVEKLVSKHTKVAYNGDYDEILDKKLSIDGTDSLTERLETIIANFQNETELMIKEGLKYKSYVNQELINKEIEILEAKMNPDVIPAPEDIFSAEDYTLETITCPIFHTKVVLETLNNIPSDYLDFITVNDSNKYFESENKVTITCKNGGWDLNFVIGGEYGTSISNKTDKLKSFVKENKDFIADFISATTNLIGTQNVKLNNELISLVK